MIARNNSTRPSKIDDSLARLGLPELIQWAAQKGAERQLRLFACWCARQTLSTCDHPEWESAMELAEQFALGKADAATMAAARKKLKGIAVAAGSTGHRVGALNSYTMLACFQTLRPDAAEAALYASQEHWAWTRKAAEKRKGLSRERSLTVGRGVIQVQARKLREMLRGAAAPVWGGPAN